MRPAIEVMEGRALLSGMRASGGASAMMASDAANLAYLQAIEMRLTSGVLAPRSSATS